MKSVFFKGEKKRLIKTVSNTIINCVIIVDDLIACIYFIGELANRGINVRKELERICLDPTIKR